MKLPWQPYSSISVTEFWRRWHISLSSWFRDYLYIPLGGNRVSPFRTYANLGIVFLLCGLWHGAAWTFIIWGAWHGALLIIERMGLGRMLERLPAIVSQAYTLLVVMIGWVFFRANDVPHALKFLGVMFGGASSGAHPWQMDFGAAAAAALIIGTLIATWRFSGEVRIQSAAPRKGLHMVLSSMPLRAAGAAAAFVLCAASLAAGTYNPFIYFRF